MPIHGHTKIELTNQTTGEVEVIEKDNMVTNAVTQIFNASNGAALPRQANLAGEYGVKSGWELLESMYGGILLYDTALGSDPATLFAPASAHLVGTGVPKVLNNGNGLQRGSFNSEESKTDLANGVVTFVYDFGTHQANGVIASVCLTSRYGGFFGESETALSSVDGACTMAYVTSSIFEQGDSLFPKTMAGTDDKLYGRPLYADPDKDEMLFCAVSGSKLVLRYVSTLTKEIDLFNPIGTCRVKSSTELDISDLTQSPGVGFNAVGYDADADKLYVVCTPKDSSYRVQTTNEIRVRTYDRKTLTAKTYKFTNPTGDVLAGCAGEYATDGRYAGLSNTCRVLGGCLIMAKQAVDPGKAVPFYKIPLEDPTRVTVIENHGLAMPRFTDLHDGRIYYISAAGYTYGRVMNLDTNEIRAIEACGNYGVRPYWAVPVLGQPTVPYMAVYSTSGTGYEGEIHQGIRRNYLATINDLDAPVEKTADKTMKITYTLRKEES